MKAKLPAVIFALACSIAAIAQERKQDFPGEVRSTRSRAEVQAELAQARAAGQLGVLGDAYGDVDSREYPSTLSRAEVLADLQIWRDSGLETISAGERGYDFFTPAYRQAQARYLALRASPRYAELVQRIGQERGASVASRSTGTSAQ